MHKTIQMKIEYIDGTNQVFEWQIDPEVSESINAVSQLQRGLHEEYILLEMGDKMTIVYKYNVKTIEINAVPAKLPASAIRGVRLAD